MIKLEICTSSLESALQAVKAGAKRIELCDNLKEGGTTPPLSWAEEIIQSYDIQVFILIRPLGGDFLYTDNEYSTMKRDINHFAKAGCRGIVIGILTKKGKVDKERTRQLVELAKSYNMSVTFHRAIDRTENIFDAMEDIIELGCDRILTSGGTKNTIEGKETIKKMIDQANSRIIIMPGGGINENNIRQLAQYTKAKELHGSFSCIKKTEMTFIKSTVDSYENDYTTQVSSSEKIKKAIEQIKDL